MGLIFYLSSLQTTGIGGNSYWWRFFILKSSHIIEYSVLVILLFFAINKYNYSLFIGILYACSDEIHQTFTVGRMATYRDVFFDISGLFLGLIILNILLKIRFFNNFVIQKNIK